MTADVKRFKMEEVAQHNSEQDMWMVIDGDVFDLTKFVRLHPGGSAVLIPYAGKDATEVFFGLHRIEVLRKYKRLRIGKLEGAKESTVDVQDPAALSPVPYSEPSAFQGFRSPYYDESHWKLRDAVAAFREAELKPICDRYEATGKHPPLELFQKMGKAGLLLARLGPGPWVKEAEETLGIRLPGGVPAEKFDYFHEQLCHQEFIRVGTPSFCAGLGDGFIIGMPAVLKFATPEVRKRVAADCLTGNKRICLAITEPHAGSDVANIVTTAKKTPDGQHFIVNGVKKWITNGEFSDYFVTAVRTGGKGMFGITMLLIERSEGVSTSHVPTAYAACAGTAYIEFKNVKVPVANVLGRVNQGFRCIMYNFNHERWMIIAQVLASMRAIQDDVFKWAHQRKVFGKTLDSQPVIREKLARMVSLNESMQTWLESITYQMNRMEYNEMQEKLAGPLALCKFQCTRASLQVADDAAQILGGRAITKTGMGKNIESFIRTIKYGAILGGSEEIMADLGIRQALRKFPKHAKM